MIPRNLNHKSDRLFDLIAFDWDGTLFDSTQIIVRCIQAAVKDVGGTVPTDEAAGYVIGLGLAQALGLWAVSPLGWVTLLTYVLLSAMGLYCARGHFIRLADS